jgi:serine/threonine-protein kinase
MTDDPHNDSSDVERSGAGRTVPSMFGRYRLTRLLGRGAFGEVYLAVDTVKNRTVALKLLIPHLSGDPTFRARMAREASTAGRLNEPHVVPVHDFGEVDGQLYVDMRMVSGTNLGAVLEREGALAPDRAVSIIYQVASALDAAHSEGITHRDVKPANILVDGHDFACLVDFGLATAAYDSKLTSTHTTIGTFAYMAPERITGENVDSRVDVYSLACVLYQSLTGQFPYATDDATALCAAHLTAPIPAPSQKNPNVPEKFDEVISRGMAKTPQDRYRTAGELAEAARRALSNGYAKTAGDDAAPDRAAAPPAGVGRGRRVIATSGARAALAIVTAAAAVVAAAVVVSVHGGGPSRHTQGSTADSAVESIPHIAATIPVGDRPEAVAVDSGSNTVYTANYQSGTVSVIDSVKRVVVSTVRVGGGPVDIAVDPAHSIACVTNNRDDTVSIIDTAKNSVHSTIKVGTNPWGVGIDVPARRAYVANMWDYTVSVINLETFKTDATVNVGKNPYGVAVDSAGHAVYVANSSDNTVSIIDTDNLTATSTIPVAPDPRGIAIDASSRTAYITHEAEGKVSALDLRSRHVRASIRVGGNPYGVAVDSKAHTVYTGNHDSAVTAIDMQSFQVRGVIRIGTDTFALDVDPGTHIVYTADQDNKVSVVEMGERP